MHITPKILPALLVFSALFACTSSGEATLIKTGTSGGARSKAQIAEAMFVERCKRAGEKIHRTVTDVQGVYLLRVRPDEINFENQYALDDPYGSDLGGDDYISTFLHEFYLLAEPRPGTARQIAYRYVEALDPKDGKRYRYTGRIEEPWLSNQHYLKGYHRFVLDKALAAGPAPKYGVTYEDISTREERNYWIAGSSLKVIDIATGEVLAERVGYMMDVGQGGTAGGRAPWLLAAEHACPAFPGLHASRGQFRQAAKFVEKTLKPVHGNN